MSARWLLSHASLPDHFVHRRFAQLPQRPLSRSKIHVATLRFGRLKPRYRFALNPFPDVRWSRCPKCEKLMHARKFPLLLILGENTLLTLGFTCRYCAPCEFIIAHQHELELQLAIFHAQHPDVRIDDFFVVGTVDRGTWKRSCEQPEPQSLEELREHTSDIRDRRVLNDPRRIWVKASGGGAAGSQGNGER